MNTKRTIGYGFLAVMLALAFAGCATTPEAYQDVDYAMQSNDFEAGIEAIKKGQEGKKPLYDEKNAVSLYLDKGLLEHYAGNYANSSADLQQAERLIEEAFTKSVTQEVASYIANDNTKEYPGEDFEDIYINVFNALNYYNKGDLEGALVEIRKLTWTNGKLDMLGRKYEGAKASAGEYVLEQLGKIGLKINPELPQGDSVNFADSTLARYLGALFYLGNGNADSARIEFERLRAAHAANPNVYYHPFPESAMAARNVPQGKARLNVVGFAGLSPVKEEGVFVSAFPFFQNAVLRTPEFKLPKFVKRPNRIDRIEVVVEGADAFNLELIEDMGAVAEETYNARFGSLFFKTYIRTLLKYAAVDVAAVAAGKTKGGSLAQTAAAAAGKKTADATEKADIRMSRYFPGKAYIGGVNLDPGSYTVAVRYYQGNNVIATEERRIDVSAGALNLLETINLGGSQPLQNAGQQTANNGSGGTSSSPSSAQSGNSTGQAASDYQNFTAGQRWGTWGLNWLIPGLGSYVIMHDTRGGTIQLAVGLGGTALSLSGSVLILNSLSSYYINPAKYYTGFGLLIAGGISGISRFTYNIVRSATYGKPRRTASLVDPEAWNIAILPGKNGIEQVRLAYTLRF